MNKEKLINWLNIKLIDFTTCEHLGFVIEDEWQKLINFIEKGEFDND